MSKRTIITPLIVLGVAALLFFVINRFEQNEVLASARAEAAAKLALAKASLLEAKLGLSLAQGELQRVMGEIPR